ncbi:hypothetical protein GCM10007989_20930 [Devosia pacifica]|uniref:Uncharacterized protein n=1 Tax=Devosia pacifica TaxID=1335967 RepID=A0A918VSF5_9HYPH|nr:hypothetical protein [Devosia pacifica]GHA25070.1 hypothetical protein GCM10007989_20930 [Devosia pacifica]
MREHWGNCITHFNSDVSRFISDYFARVDCKCVLLAGAGFDPRTQTIPSALAETMGQRLQAILVREERGEAIQALRDAADQNEGALRDRIENLEIWPIDIFDPEDSAPVGGTKISERLRRFALPADVTDIVLDMSALSLGISYPAARILLGWSERRSDLNLHIMVTSNPELDGGIVGEPAARPQAVRGFTGALPDDSERRVARIWLPQLAKKRNAAFRKIHASFDELYKVCPILPFPASDPRRADELIAEYGEEIRELWNVNNRDFMYVSERNPLDTFRTIETLKARYDKTVAGVYESQIILSPIGSKVMAAGAMMAAIKHDLAVHYVEALRYEMEAPDFNQGPTDLKLVHVWLDGPVYDGFAAQFSKPEPETTSDAEVDLSEQKALL